MRSVAAFGLLTASFVFCSLTPTIRAADVIPGRYVGVLRITTDTPDADITSGESVPLIARLKADGEITIIAKRMGVVASGHVGAGVYGINFDDIGTQTGSTVTIVGGRITITIDLPFSYTTYPGPARNGTRTRVYTLRRIAP